MTPEGRIKAKLRARLKVFGSDVWVFMPVQRGMGIPALDFLICLCGRFVSIETKKDGKSDMTARQETTAGLIRGAGGDVFLVYDDASLDRCMLHLHYIHKAFTGEVRNAA